MKKIISLLLFFIITVFSYAQLDLSERRKSKENNLDLISAAYSGDKNAVLAYLKNGADVNSVNYENITALMYAAQQGNIEITQLLIDSGANVNAIPDNGVNALIGAAQFNQIVIVDTLIQFKADKNAQDINGATALMYAAAYNYVILADMLLFYGTDPNLKAIDGSSALIIAAFNGNLDLVKLLLKKGADVNAIDYKGFSPLMAAVQENKLDVVKIILNAKPNLDILNIYGLSALGIAIEKGYVDIAKALIDNNVDINLANKLIKRPITIAHIKKEKELKKYLKEKGAKNNYSPIINKISIGINTSFNTNDFMLGGALGFEEAIYGLGFNIGYETRIRRKSILLEQDNNLYYQLWEKRSIWYADLQKRFILGHIDNEPFGLSIGVKEAYTYGDYKGWYKKVESRFITIPKASLFMNQSYLKLSIGYEYIDYEIYQMPPHRITFSLTFLINTNSKNKLKKINWLY